MFDFFQKKCLSDVRSEIHLDQRNIISTGPFVWALKKIMFKLDLFRELKKIQTGAVGTLRTNYNGIRSSQKE